LDRYFLTPSLLIASKIPIMKENIAAIKAFQFATQIVKLSVELQKEHDYVISKQLLKSATSIGANIEEATAAISRKDFIQKLSIASKEARESKYWINLLRDTAIVQFDYEELLDEIEQLDRLLTSSVKTAQENLKKNQK
jgi:four helix bundle protein